MLLNPSFIKRVILLAFTAILLFSSAYAQTMPDSTKRFLDNVLDIMQKESLNRDSVNWDTIKKHVYQKAADTKKITDLAQAIRYVFEQLHDNHGSLMLRGFPLASNMSPQKYPKELMVQMQAVGFPPKLKVKVLDNDYGYVLVPSIQTRSAGDYDKYAQQIKDSICAINSDKIKGWIIDLRLNPGGNMYPMLGGIAVIIGDGKGGEFVNIKGEAKQQWSVKNGDAYIDTTRLTHTTAKCAVKNAGGKIAVLIGPLTQSSGEAVAISLEGRPKTKFFGENTGGLTTGNLTHELDYHFTLLVAGYVEADRNNKPYRYLVKPDVLIPGGDNFVDLNQDKKVMAALEWLKQ